MSLQKRPRKFKFKRIDDAAMEAAEHHYAKSSGLMAGAGKILTDFIGNASWGTEITIDVALTLLEEAKAERIAGNLQYRKGKNP